MKKLLLFALMVCFTTAYAQISKEIFKPLSPRVPAASYIGHAPGDFITKPYWNENKIASPLKGMSDFNMVNPIAIIPIFKDTLAPKITRVNTSLPKSSVPKKCSVLGGNNLFSTEVVIASWA